MPLFLLFTVIGVFSVAWFPALPSLNAALAGLSLGAIFSVWLWSCRQKTLSLLLLALFFGLTYGVVSGHLMLRQQLPEPLDRLDFQITGYIKRLPVTDAKSVRFYFLVSTVEDQQQQWLVGKTLRLSWYSGVDIAPGEQWQLHVRLRRPRGFINPGGFDYQAWLLREGIAATGYIRESVWNKHLPDSGAYLNLSIDNFRWQLREVIRALPLPEASRGLLTALTIGDGSLLSASLWSEFAKAGVIHLLVISGLHIGLSAVFGYWFGAGIARCVGLFFKGVVAPRWGYCFSVLVATHYALLSGFGLPAQRALVMTIVASTLFLNGRNVHRGTGFLLALLIVALIDPLAVQSAGFWLSFSAVAVLLWLLSGDQGMRGWCKRFIQFVSVQWWLFIALFGILMVWQLPQPLLSPLVNLVAIPWVSFVIVPLCLLAVLVYFLFPGLADSLWTLAGWQLTQFVELIASIPDWRMPLVALSNFQLLAFFVALALLLLPKGVPGRYLWMLLLLAVGISARHDDSHPPLTIAVLDVGQGLAVVVTTRDHTLVYDTGPAYSENFNAGSGIVVPFLKNIGRNNIDTLMVSHGDSDHAGGVSGLLSHYQPKTIFVGEALDISDSSKVVTPCQQGIGWVWNQVQFQVLSPQMTFYDVTEESNNRSCVLLISYKDQHILLPGDIERSAEYRLLRSPYGKSSELAPLTLLVAPHHGSITSSSRSFLQAFKPEHVVFSAGYKHHFGHPHPSVRARYDFLGTVQWQTAISGAIIFHWNELGEMAVSEARHKSRRYWF